MKEMKGLIKNGTWELLNLALVKKKRVACKWVFTVKHKENDSIKRQKAKPRPMDLITNKLLHLLP